MNINFGSITGTDLLKDIVIVTLLVIVFLQKECGSGKSPSGDLAVTTTTKVIHDTLSIPSKPQPPQISYVDTGSTKRYPVYVPQQLTRQDTEQIVSAWLKPYFYTQDFTDEKYKAHFSTVVVHDSLFNPQLSVQWLAPDETINQVNPAPSIQNLKLFLGLHVGAAPSQFDFGPEIALLTKSDHLYAISNDLALKQPNLELHVDWKLHL
jgi:hypothetical protein